ncbi:DsbC family protein [Candidatus Venteria ishoeyi]|uniref:Thiol:disulfide interchange protein n=1 Tax=Candidatus Venteria ishoeyi TaxID=1899563 RepID=A0A1H6FES4_9GAMM|nr:DsbC family protein [Candidatus Venteria ishoeyi]SEH08578.1 Thiol:disulfide interchange protein DsbC precursor [Candidatus Venteria ishoeyi]
MIVIPNNMRQQQSWLQSISYLGVVMGLLSLLLHPAIVSATSPPPASEAVKSALLKSIYASGLVHFKAEDLEVRPATDLIEAYETVVGPYIFQITQDASMSVRDDLLFNAIAEKFSPVQYAQVRQQTLHLLDEKDMIIYPEIGEKRYTLTVFIDINCEFCAMLHRDIPKLRKAGIRVRYLAFPKNGLEGMDYEQTLAVWCDKDRKQALNDARDGLLLDTQTCEHPVDQQFFLGESLKILGTPTLIFEDGNVFTGYFSFKDLLERLKKHNPLHKQTEKESNKLEQPVVTDSTFTPRTAE